MYAWLPCHQSTYFKTEVYHTTTNHNVAMKLGIFLKTNKGGHVSYIATQTLIQRIEQIMMIHRRHV